MRLYSNAVLGIRREASYSQILSSNPFSLKFNPLVVGVIYLAVIISSNVCADKQKGTPGRKVGRGRKSKATAAKVALMKIKMKAVGDKGVPDSERIHLLVALPIGHTEMTKPCFFSKVN